MKHAFEISIFMVVLLLVGIAEYNTKNVQITSDSTSLFETQYPSSSSEKYAKTLMQNNLLQEDLKTESGEINCNDFDRDGTVTVLDEYIRRQIEMGMINIKPLSGCES